ncbi:MAG: AI-2E family transporter [Vicinamibacterales bacterium]
MTTQDARKLIIFGIVASALAVGLVFVLYLVRSTLLLLYVSALFAIGLAPLVRIIERQRLVPIGTRRMPRWLAILLIYAAVLATVGLVGWVVFPPLVQQSQDLWSSAPQRLEQLQGVLLKNGILEEPLTLRMIFSRVPAGGSADAVGTVLGALFSVVGGAFGLISILLLTFYFLVESRGIFRTFVRLFPEAGRERVASVSAEVSTKISAWLGGQMLLSLIIGVTSAIGLGLMGVPYFYVFAVISAIGELVPIVGPILAAVPAVLVAFTVSPTLALGVGVFFIVQQQLENNVLVPKIMGRQVGLGAVTVIIALLLGGELLGLVGALLAVPTAAIVQVLFDEMMLDDDGNVDIG